MIGDSALLKEKKIIELGYSAFRNTKVDKENNIYVSGFFSGTNVDFDLTDSENLQRTGKNLNAKHAYAMQPIVLEIVNKNNENDIDGYTPGVDIPGVQIAEDYGNLGELGKTSDPLLNAAVNLITTGSKGNFNSKTSIHSKEIYNSSIAKPMGNNMYIELKDLKLK